MSFLAESKEELRPQRFAMSDMCTGLAHTAAALVRLADPGSVQGLLSALCQQAAQTMPLHGLQGCCLLLPGLLTAAVDQVGPPLGTPLSALFRRAHMMCFRYLNAFATVHLLVFS